MNNDNDSEVDSEFDLDEEINGVDEIIDSDSESDEDQDVNESNQGQNIDGIMYNMEEYKKLSNWTLNDGLTGFPKFIQINYIPGWNGKAWEN